MFFENCKKKMFLLFRCIFIKVKKYFMQILLIERKWLFYQALALQICGAPIKNAGLSPSFFDLHLKTTVVRLRKYKL